LPDAWPRRAIANDLFNHRLESVRAASRGHVGRQGALLAGAPAGDWRFKTI
jgi:hypothetical protein